MDNIDAQPDNAVCSFHTFLLGLTFILCIYTVLQGCASYRHLVDPTPTNSLDEVSCVPVFRQSGSGQFDRLTNRLESILNLGGAFILGFYRQNLTSVSFLVSYRQIYIKFSCTTICKKLPSNSAQYIPFFELIQFSQLCRVLPYNPDLYKIKISYNSLSECQLSD
jgi:hypothetical protein